MTRYIATLAAATAINVVLAGAAVAQGAVTQVVAAIRP